MNWIVTSGKAEVKGNTIKYKPETFKNQLGNEEILASIVKSNIFFENGEITFKVNSKSQQGRCQIIFNYEDAPMILVGLNTNNVLYGITKYNSTTNNLEYVSGSGIPETFQAKQDHVFKVKVNGSIIELFVNDVLVSTAFEQINPSQVTFYFSSPEEIVVKDIIIQARKPKAFIVMQFTDEFNILYKEVIKPVVDDYGFDCERADDAHTTNPILQDIVQSIKECSVIIADITPNNPNVFYEIGYAHAINKPTILLCDRKRDKLPFDISGFRTLFYDNTIAGKSAVENSLKKFLEGLNPK